MSKHNILEPLVAHGHPNPRSSTRSQLKKPSLVTATFALVCAVSLVTLFLQEEHVVANHVKVVGSSQSTQNVVLEALHRRQPSETRLRARGDVVVEDAVTLARSQADGHPGAPAALPPPPGALPRGALALLALALAAPAALRAWAPRRKHLLPPAKSVDLAALPGPQAAPNPADLQGLLQKLGQQGTAVLTAAALTVSGLQTPALALTIPKAPPPMINLTRDEAANVKVFQDNTPSVVFVTNLATVGKINRNDWSLDLTQIPRGSGSGFVWDDKGHIITNHHVIAKASDIRVTTIDQQAYPARVVGFDEDKDVAMLEVTDPEAIAKFRPVQQGCSNGLLVGQKVLAIGNPFGLDHTLTQGIISGLGRVITSPSGRPITGVIQTDAAINPGNSGGPLIDSAGNVIGMNSAILDPTGEGSSSGVGFAIPIDIVKSVAGQLLTYGRVLRPVMGVTIAPDETLQSLNVEGVLVLDTPKGGPAAKAGIRPSRRDPETGRLILGDIIVSIDDTKLESSTDLFTALDDYQPGDVVTVTVLRDGEGAPSKRIKLSVTLGERKPGRD